MPIFWLGILLILVFAVKLHWLPSGGTGSLRYLILPAIALGSAGAAIIARLTRSALLEVLGQDYIRTARAKGVSEPKLIYRHALRNALIPVLTVTGLQIGALLGGAVITETIFVLPGVGALVVSSIFERDFPLVQGVVLFLALAHLFVNLAVDIAYAYLDPRIRLG